MILVTGGTGFIGKRLVDKLAKSDNKIRILSSKKNLQHSYKGSVEFIHHDLMKDEITKNILSGCDTIYHLAGYAHDLKSNSNINHKYWQLNVDATINLARMAVHCGVKKFIFVSSVKAGGSFNSNREITEKDQKNPEDIYGITKREAEIRLFEIGRQTGLFVSIIRPSLIYGPGVKGNLRLMLSGIDNGWFPPLPETGNFRSLIHVDDVVDAIFLLKNDDRANGEIFIATDGVAYSARDIYISMCKFLGKPMPFWSVPKFFISFLSSMFPAFKHKINKLNSNEIYSNKKLESIGFQSKNTLGEVNEKSF